MDFRTTLTILITLILLMGSPLNLVEAKDINSVGVSAGESATKNTDIITGEKVALGEVELALTKIEKDLQAQLQLQESLQQDALVSNKEFKSLQKEYEQLLQEQYIEWKTQSQQQILFSHNQDALKAILYYDVLTNEKDNQLASQANYLAEVEQRRAVSEQQITELTEQKKVLKAQQQELEKQKQLITIAAVEATQTDKFRAFQANKQVGPTIDVVQEQVQEQKVSAATATQSLGQPGTIYFSGIKPDGFGHGVGLSQWGAYGAGQKGWSAQQILTFYYTNTRLEVRPNKTINVIGYGTMSVEDYVAGLGEIPSKACADTQQLMRWTYIANQQNWLPDDPRRSKYVIDNPNTPWDCWPEEAIKAQVIAARSYGVTSSQPICTTAQCQVYAGHKDKAWAALETKDQYLISNGATHTNDIVRAYYSAYNHNGWGTADNDTIWSDRSGNGSVYSYLRAVNDKNTTYHYIYTQSDWRTNAYNVAQLNEMLIWCGQNCSSKSWFQPNVVDKIKTLQSITVSKDPSGRVKKVYLKGTNGVTVSIAGWYLRDIFNLWVSKTLPSGQEDYMQSITFVVNTV